MPYALFTNNEQISKAYKTEHEVWKKADEAGLVVDVASQEEKQHPQRVLDEDYCIKPCPADADHADFVPEQDSNQHVLRQATRSHVRTGRQTKRHVLTPVLTSAKS